MKLSIIVPVYNEEKNVYKLLSLLNKVNYPIPYEIVAVNDGSTDKTRQELLKARRSFKNLKVISYKHNKGKGHAVRTGIKNSSGDIVAIQDADFEYNPRQIPKLISSIFSKNSKAVYGSRFKGTIKNISPVNLVGNKALTFVTNLLFFTSLSDMETCYKVVSRDVINKLDLKSDGFEIEAEITAKLLKHGYKINEIPIVYVARTKAAGKKINIYDGFKTLITLFKCRLNML